jgi:hypothetical protein
VSLTNFKADKSLLINGIFLSFEGFDISKKFISKFSTHLLLKGVKTEKGFPCPVVRKPGS